MKFAVVPEWLGMLKFQCGRHFLSIEEEILPLYRQVSRFLIVLEGPYCTTTKISSPHIGHAMI